MSKVTLKDKTFRVHIPASDINKAVGEVAHRINIELKDKKPLFLAVLNGSFMFASDLLKKVTIDCEISFVKVSSYHGTSTTGSVKSLIGLNEDIKGRTIVIVEDIVDTGLTMEKVLKELEVMEPAEVRICTLLYKPEAFRKKFDLDYVAIVVPNDFLVGYGLDYDGLGRNLPDIYVLDN
ncbi:MAG: hypoxanthine phosphoribosyltransferase [Bacteroidetes bacterium]|nr:hypoxanthine phosphoribosyltransferase [Bacteroidota bacterium]